MNLVRCKSAIQLRPNNGIAPQLLILVKLVLQPCKNTTLWNSKLDWALLSKTKRC